MRWNPSRQEWVTYSSERENRTSFPPKKYCPFCPGSHLNFPTEISFRDFEVAVFPNRWSSFNTHNKNIDISGIKTKPSNGHSEIIVYSDVHDDTIAEMPLDHIQLLVKTWNDRYIELLSNKIPEALRKANKNQDVLFEVFQLRKKFGFIPSTIDTTAGYLFVEKGRINIKSLVKIFV